MLSQELRSQVQYVDVLVIGAGPAGMAAAIAAREAGVSNLLVLERENDMGGILRQCIHNGFGLHRFKEELTGPEYAQRDIDRVKEMGIEVRCGTTVLSVDGDRFVTAVSREKGVQLFEAGAIVLAMGCRERPRGALATPARAARACSPPARRRNSSTWRAICPASVWSSSAAAISASSWPAA